MPKEYLTLGPHPLGVNKSYRTTPDHMAAGWQIRLD